MTGEGAPTATPASGGAGADERHAGRRPLRPPQGRVRGTPTPDDASVREQEALAEAKDADGPAAAAERLDRAQPAGLPPHFAAAVRAAGELLARLGGAGAPEVGAAASCGWTLAARLDLERPAGRAPSDLWALQPPEGGGVEFVATGGPAPEPWTRERVEEELDAKRDAMSAAERFARAVGGAAPPRLAGRPERPGGGRERHGAAERTERHGAAALRFVEGEPARAERAFLLGAERLGPGVEARRVDAAEPSTGTAGRPWAEQVWARDTGGGVWARGRLRLEAGRAVFVDEPGAGTGRRGDRRPGGAEKARNLEADLLGCPAVRRKAAECEAYAWLLRSALADSAWRHEDGSAFRVAARDAPRLVAQAVGRGDFADWLWSAPAGVLDGEVLGDLAALGWRWVGLR